MRVTSTPFPLAFVSAAFGPPLVTFILGVLWGRPQISPDTATGLLAWADFVAGGPWNALVEPSPDDLMHDSAVPVTWWSPGQYVVPGLLASAGLSHGLAVLLTALLMTASFVAGLDRLARDLGSPDAARTWVALGAAGAWHTLYAFGFFIGGEVALAAVWPWIFVAAWRLRARPFPLVASLPPLLLLGSFAKHSFAIYAVALLAFLALEAVRETGRAPTRVARALAPLVLVGVLYLLGRVLLFEAGPSPAGSGQVPRRLAAAGGFSALGPAFAATGAGSLAGRLWAMAGVNAEDGWDQLGGVLLVLAPVFLLIYARLAVASAPLLRLAGVAALVATSALAVLFARGASVSLEDRHFRPAGALLLAVVASVAVGAPGPRRTAARAAILAVAGFGLAAAIQRHHTLHRLAATGPAGFSIPDCPSPVQRAIQDLGRPRDGRADVLYLPMPMLALLAPQGRLLVSDALNREAAWFDARPFQGSVPRLVVVVPATFDADGRGDRLRAAFRAWQPSDWVSRELDGWAIWTATTGGTSAP